MSLISVTFCAAGILSPDAGGGPTADGYDGERVGQSGGTDLNNLNVTVVRYHYHDMYLLVSSSHFLTCSLVITYPTHALQSRAYILTGDTITQADWSTLHFNIWYLRLSSNLIITNIPASLFSIF